jgi:beta-lactam-binding protein with PASTA domain
MRRETAPDVVGLRLAVAQEVCERRGIEVLVDNDVEWPSWQSAVPGPPVIQQWPAAGERIDAASTVVVVRVRFDREDTSTEDGSAVSIGTHELWR